MADVRVLDRDLTWEQFLELPDDDRYRHAELIDGEVVVSAATPLHQLIVGRLWSAIDTWTSQGGGRGEVTMEPAVQISERTGYLPDLAWYCQAKCAPLDALPAFENPPDLAVEVLSPSTRSFDAVRKCHDYAVIGVSELWLIDPDGPRASILRRAADVPDVFVDAESEVEPDDPLASPLLPGFAVPLGALTRR